MTDRDEDTPQQRGHPAGRAARRRVPGAGEAVGFRTAAAFYKAASPHLGKADIAKVDAEFFPDGRWKTNFLINLGYGDDSLLFNRNPRLSFDEACRVL